MLWSGLHPSRKHLTWFLAPGLFMTVCGCQGCLHMHSADPVELHWPSKAPSGSGHIMSYCQDNLITMLLRRVVSPTWLKKGSLVWRFLVTPVRPSMVIQKKSIPASFPRLSKASPLFFSPRKGVLHSRLHDIESGRTVLT